MDDKRSLFEDIEKHLLEDEKPSIFLDGLCNSPIFMKEYPFTLVSALIDTPQNTKYHPEGSVWNHTLLVVDEAAQRKGQSDSPRAFMWVALLHDIGKAPTTKIRKGRITSYDHDKVGEELAEKFLSAYMEEEDFIKEVSSRVRWHMQPLYVIKELPYADIPQMEKEVEVDEVALFSLCDRLGRGGILDERVSEEKENMRKFTERCCTILHHS